MITDSDAVTVAAKQLPDDGITFREFVTKTVRLRGQPDEVIEEVLRLGALDGIQPDSIVKRRPDVTRLN